MTMLTEGDPVPDVELLNLEGKPVRTSDFRGQKIVFYFYPKDDTSGCTAEAQAFTGLASEFEKAGTWNRQVVRSQAEPWMKTTAVLPSPKLL